MEKERRIGRVREGSIDGMGPRAASQTEVAPGCRKHHQRRPLAAVQQKTPAGRTGGFYEARLGQARDLGRSIAFEKARSRPLFLPTTQSDAPGFSSVISRNLTGTSEPVKV
jgi:hypothetical protein